MKEEKQQFNVYLTPETIREMKHRSINERLSLSELVEKVFVAYISQAALQPGEERQSDTSVKSGSDMQPQTQEDATITLQPMLHVENMGKALDFYTRLGATVLHGSRDEDWALLSFGDSELGVLAHPANPEQKEGDIELNFEYKGSLRELEKTLREANITIARSAGDEGFGYQLQLESPDGMLVKINQLDSELYQ